MAIKKTITIEVIDSEGYESKFKLDSKNMRRYEIIGVLELAVAGIKDECIKASNDNK